MDFAEINSLLAAATNFIQDFVNAQTTYKQQLADKDKQIANLQDQHN